VTSNRVRCASLSSASRLASVDARWAPATSHGHRARSLSHHAAFGRETTLIHRGMVEPFPHEKGRYSHSTVVENFWATSLDVETSGSASPNPVGLHGLEYLRSELYG
jgi:hypothetical protein